MQFNRYSSPEKRSPMSVEVARLNRLWIKGQTNQESPIIVKNYERKQSFGDPLKIEPIVLSPPASASKPSNHSPVNSSPKYQVQSSSPFKSPEIQSQKPFETKEIHEDKRKYVNPEVKRARIEAIRAKAQILAATLCIVWLKSLSTRGRKASIVNRRVSAFELSRKTTTSEVPGGVNMTAKEIDFESRSNSITEPFSGKPVEIPEPPPLPTSWPPVFDEIQDTPHVTSSSSGATSAHVVASVKSTVKQVQWDVVQTVEGTLWEDFSDVAELIDTKALFNDIESDFTTQAKKVTNKFPLEKVPLKMSATDLLSGLKSSTKSSNQSNQLLDINRAQNINIMLAKFNRISVDELATVVYYLDLKSLDSSSIAALQQFLPTKEEVKLIKDYLISAPSAESKLGKAERFLYEMSKIPRYEDRLQVMNVCISLKETISTIEYASQIMLSAVGEIRGSVRLKCMLKVLLDLGNSLKNNFLVSEISAGQLAERTCKGFKFSSVSKIAQTKSNKGENIVEYVVAKLYSQTPEVLEIDRDLPSLADAIRVNFPKIKADLMKIKGAIGLLKDIYAEDAAVGDVISGKKNDNLQAVPKVVLSKIAENISEFDKLCSVAATNIELATSDFTELCQYLGENDSSITPELLFGQIAQFVKSISVALENTAAKAKRMARNKI